MKKRTSKSTGTVTFAATGLALGALGGLAYYFRHELVDALGFNKPKVSADIRAKLPIAHDLKTISDNEGNYDIDGVSYDVEGTIVSSDDTKHFVAPI